MTLVTATLEGLNVIDVVMAESLSAQVLTVHPLNGDNPLVSFPGTSINGLRLEEFPCRSTLDLNICAQGNGDGFPASRA